MSIDIESERLVPIRQAPKHIPGRPHLSAVYRWMQRSNNPLESILVGGRRWTSVEAIHRFIGNSNPTAATTTIPTPARREREIEAAERRLDAAGVKA